MPPCSPRCRRSRPFFYTAMDLQCGKKLRSILTDDNNAIAKSINENRGFCSQKLFAVRIEGASTGSLAPTGEIIKIIARTFHLPFKTKIGRGDAPVLAPLSPIAENPTIRRKFPNTTIKCDRRQKIAPCPTIQTYIIAVPFVSRDTIIHSQAHISSPFASTIDNLY